MTSMLVGLLVVLIGGRLRVRPRPRRPPTPPLGPRESSGPRPWHRLAGRTLARRPIEPGPEHVAAWCDALARAVGGGATLATAIRTVEPPNECVTAVGSIRLALERGAPLDDACSSESHPAALRVAITVIRTTRDVGPNRG